MVDPVTEQILMEAQVIDSIKKIVPMLKSALNRKDTKMLKKISKQLPKRKPLVQLEKEAAQKFPNFRENYKKAQREVVKSKHAKGIERPVAFITAIATTVTKKPTSEITDKLSLAAAEAQKAILFPGDIQLLKLILFIIFVLIVFTTKGAVLGVMFQGLVWCVASILGLLGFAVDTAQNPPESTWDLLF
jgi:hypothetical protein